MSNYKQIKVRALKEGLAFGNMQLYQEGDYISAILDTSTDTFVFKNVFTHIESLDSPNFILAEDLGYIDGDIENADVDKGIIEYLKSEEIRRWLVENKIAEKFNIGTVIIPKNTRLTNNVEGNGGAEFFEFPFGTLYVSRRDTTDLMVQIRKGSVFYIDMVTTATTLKAAPFRNILHQDYRTLKEIKYIIENDYKHWSGLNAIRIKGQD